MSRTAHVIAYHHATHGHGFGRRDTWSLGQTGRCSHRRALDLNTLDVLSVQIATKTDHPAFAFIGGGRGDRDFQPTGIQACSGQGLSGDLLISTAGLADGQAQSLIVRIGGNTHRQIGLTVQGDFQVKTRRGTQLGRIEQETRPGQPLTVRHRVGSESHACGLANRPQFGKILIGQAFSKQNLIAAGFYRGYGGGADSQRLVETFLQQPGLVFRRGGSHTLGDRTGGEQHFFRSTSAGRCLNQVNVLTGPGAFHLNVEMPAPP